MDKFVGVYEHNKEENTVVVIWGESEVQKNVKLLEFHNREEVLESEDGEWSLQSYEYDLATGETKFMTFRTEEDMNKIRSIINSSERRIRHLNLELEETNDLEEKALIGKRIEGVEKRITNLLKARDIQSKRFIENHKYSTLEEVLEEDN